MFKIFGQRKSGGVAVLWIFFDAFETNRGKIAVYFWIQQARFSRFSIEQYLDGLVSCSSGKRRITRQQLVKYRTKSIDIRCACELRLITGSLFRGHVTGSAQHFQRACDSAFGFDQPRQAEVGEMR